MSSELGLRTVQMKRLSLLILTFALLLASTGIEVKAQGSKDELAIRRLVEQFFIAYQNEDLDGLMGCWAPNSPIFKNIKTFAENDFAASEEIQYSDITLTQWKIETNHVSVRVRFDHTWRNTNSKRLGKETAVFNAEFVRESNGWKFWQLSGAQEDLAERLQSAKTKEERAKLLQTERDFVTVQLVITLGDAGRIWANEGQFDEALRLSDISLEVAEVLDTPAGKAHYFLLRGDIFARQPNNEQAIDSYKKALGLFQLLKNREWEGWVRNNLGTVYARIGEYPEALPEFNASLAIMREVDNKKGEANALGNIANIHQLTGKYSDALGEYGTALKIRRETGDPEGEASTLNNIGVVYKLSGKYAEALAKYEDSLTIYRELDDLAGQATALNNIGIIYELTGKYEEALAKYEASLKIRRQIKDKVGEASALGNLGNLFQLTGKYPEAVAKFEDSLKIMRETGNRTGEATTLNNIGLTWLHYANSRARLLQLMRETGLNVTALYGLKEEYDEASKSFEASLEIVRELRDKAAQADSLGNLGLLDASQGKYADAMTHFNASMTLMREIGNTVGEAKVTEDLAALYRVQKKWQQAADYYRKAILLIELTHARTREPSLQTSFFAGNTLPYDGLIESLMELKASPDEIFAVSERAKARTLLELLSGGKVEVLKSMTGAERLTEQELKANLTTAAVQLNAAIGAGDNPERIPELKQKVSEARNNYSEFRLNLFLAHPELQVQRADYDPVTQIQLRKSLFEKTPDLCLLSYEIGDDNSYLFAITKGEGANSPLSLKMYSLKDEQKRNLTSSELTDRVRAIKLRYSNDAGPYKQRARDLYEILLAPARNDLRGRGQVVIIPDGVLYTLPFQALIDEEGRHLIESHAISYAPSVTALIQMMKLSDKKKLETADKVLFAMGRGAFPDQLRYQDFGLPYAEEQVKSIAQLFDASPWIGAEATKGNALLQMTTARYVHFATHGELNEVAPMESAIVLGKGKDDDGMLYAREFVDMNLRAELVVLSACETGSGQQLSGEGIMGLSWAVFVAGTPATVVTQWKVRDDSMNRLMVEFYRQLRTSESSGQTSITKAEALRRAQLSLMKDDAYKHPYYWAPVVLTGDWR